MTAKEHLQTAFVISKRLKRLSDRREDIRADLYSVGSPSFDQERVQSSTSGDRMLELVARVDEVEREIVKEFKALTDAKQEIIEEIERVPNENYKQLLFDRYILCQRWEKMAVDRNTGVRWIYRMHKNALAAFEKVWK